MILITSFFDYLPFMYDGLLYIESLLYFVWHANATISYAVLVNGGMEKGPDRLDWTVQNGRESFHQAGGSCLWRWDTLQ